MRVNDKLINKNQQGFKKMKEIKIVTEGKQFDEIENKQKMTEQEL